MATPPFATAADLAARGVDVTNAPLVEALLADASELLRGEIGWQVYPAAQVTVTSSGWHPREPIRLPGAPIRAVTAVTIDGTALDPADWVLVDNMLELGPTCWQGWTPLRPGGRGILAVTYTVGYDAPPAELVAWTCVLAAHALAQSTQGLPAGATPATLAVDDFRVGYSARQQAGELPIPERVLERLRARYGQAAYVTS